MNKEEILAKSREENKERDLYQLEIENKANNIALGIIIIFSTLIFALNMFTDIGFSPEAYAPVAIYQAVLNTCRHIHAEEKNKTTLFLMIGWIFSAVALAITSVVNIFI